MTNAAQQQDKAPLFFLVSVDGPGTDEKRNVGRPCQASYDAKFYVTDKGRSKEAASVVATYDHSTGITTLRISIEGMSITRTYGGRAAGYEPGR